MKNLLRLFAIAALFTFAQSCSTDVDVNADYEARTVVFGILDVTAEKQVIKINKTFLGAGNNLDYALIRDSSEYSDDALTAVVQEMSGPNVVNEFELTPEIIDNKEQEEGDIFYAPEQKVYTFSTTPDADGYYLNPEADYRLRITFTNGEVITAVTDMPEIDNSDINKPFNIPEDSPNSVNIDFVNNFNGGLPVYNSYTFKFNSAPNAKRYESFLRFTFREDVYADASQTGAPVTSTDTWMDFPLPDQITDNLNGGEDFSIALEGEEFYKLLEARLTADPKIRRVIGYDHMSSMRCFDYHLVCATTDFHTYLEVNEPITGVATDRPQYTNLSGGNLGIFSSKGRVISRNVKTNNATLTELFNGVYTADLNFCVDENVFSQYQGALFACP